MKKIHTLIFYIILLQIPISHADTIYEQGLGFLERGRAFLRGGDGIILREAWEKGDEQSYKIIQDRAMHGNSMAENLMGVINDTGQFKQPKNTEQALYWFDKAGMQSDIFALYNLGIIYSNGRVPGNKRNGEKAKKAFEMVYETKRGKLFPQDVIWLATWHYTNKQYQQAWDICDQMSVNKWKSYTNYLKGRMLLEGVSPDGKNPALAAQLLSNALNEEYMEAEPILEWYYQSQNDMKMLLTMKMIKAGTTNILNIPGATQNDYLIAQSNAHIWLENHTNKTEVLDFASTLTGFENWIP